MKPDDIEKLSRIKTVEDIKALPSNTEYVYSEQLDDSKIEALSRLNNLKVLINDGNCFVTDRGLEKISTFPSLEDLDLEWAENITDDGLVHLEKIKCLKWLDIGFCHKTTQHGVERLKKALPDCKIEVGRFQN